MKHKQIRVSEIVDTMIDAILEETKKKDPLIRSRQDVVTKAVFQLHKKECGQ